ncbi:MAG TPA: hypothetical protein VIO94_08660, partial [Phenylobacterium sp.]
ASRIRAVRLAGGKAYLAANTAGLVIVDVSNIDAPAKLGEKVTLKPAYNLDVAGTEVILAVGSVVLVSIDVSNPAAPKINGGEMASGSEGSLSDMQEGLRIASDSQALVKNSGRLFIDALNAYFAASGTNVAGLNGFKGIVLLVNGGFLRGQSWTTGEHANGPAKVTLNDTKGAIYMATGATWGRKAHEIGHWLGMWDIYTHWFSDGTMLAGTAENWCMSGNHDSGPLFSSHHLNRILNWYSSGAGGNVKELVWSPTSLLDEAFEVVAHGAAQDGNPNRYHVLKLVASSGLTYFVEVRHRPATLIYDQNLPLPAGDPGRVVVLRVTEGTSVSNTFERPIQLVDALAVGGQVVDAARNLIVTVEAQTQADPLAFRVRVKWNQPIAGDPNGAFDLTITPWDTTTWQTPDIWIDSPRNNAGAAAVYEFHEAGAPDKPILNGDRPWVKRKNKIYARIRNTGPQTVPEAWVSCYVTSPPGIGDNGDWQVIGTKKVANVPGNGELIVDFDWTPAAAGHTCISVAILPQIGEIATDNNRAQENVATFDSTSASSHQPVILEAQVRSPFTVWRKVDLLVQDLPDGWHAVVDRSHVWLPGKGAAPVRAVIWTDLGAPWARDKRIVPLAKPRVEGWTDFTDRYLPIGGILAPVKAVKKVVLEIVHEASRSGIYVGGHLTPAVANVPIVIEITDETGDVVRLYATTNAGGTFGANTGDAQIKLRPGKYRLQGFVTAGGNAGEAESNVRYAVIPA